MTETALEDVPVVARRRWRRALLAFAVLLVLLLALVWIARKPIAANFIDAELAGRGVPARYEVKKIGLHSQRLEKLSIGDPRAPDLTADWVEVDLVPTFGAPRITEVRASGVRLRGRLVNGRLTLGAVDKLLPAPSGAPFSLPDLRAGLNDARLSLVLPAGKVDVRIDGRGNLRSGFSGIYVASTPALTLGTCRIDTLRASGGIATRGGRPHLTGPAAADGAGCGESRVTAPQGSIEATLEPGLDGWRGLAQLASGDVRGGGWSASAARGQMDFAGNAARTTGTLRLAASRLAGSAGRAPRAELGGRYTVETRKDPLGPASAPATAIRFEGVFSGQGVALAATPDLSGLPAGAAGTPLEPLAKAVARFAASTRTGADLRAALSVAARGGEGAVRIGSAELNGGGGRLRFAGGEGIRLVWPGRLQPQIDGRLTTSGEDMPRILADLRQAAPGAPIAGVARMDPFVAGGSRVTLAPVRFTDGRFMTVLDMSGPLAGGRIERATLALNGRIGANGFLLNTACAPLAFERLTLSGLDLQPARLRLCPAGNALVANGRAAGYLDAPRLQGRLGESPISIAASRARFDGNRFAATALAVRLGQEDRVSRLDIANLTGSSGKGLSGGFSGTSGQIGKVPLIVSEASGRWRWANGSLNLSGAATVSDEANPARFNPLVSRNLTLAMRGNALTVRGDLLEPSTGTTIVNVDLRHDLSRGTGSADLDVADLRFTPALQPEKLTQLTLGIVANADAKLKGKGRIAWTPEAVTSTGDFHIDARSLAAPFGPVTGVRGDIHFTDLIGLITAPDQVMTVATVNPGILVEDGVVRYRILPGLLLAVDSARWPFAGGELTLRPTVLDFSEEAARQLTFDIAGLNAASFIEKLELKNLAATGTFDGTLPMIFDRDGGRIEAGRLTSRAPGGSLSYVGEVSNANLGIWGGIAFDALKAIAYKNMTIDMNGKLDGEMVSEIRFAGVSRGTIKPVATGPIARVGGQLATQLQQLPFIFNIRIRAPFRGLIGTARSFYDPSLLINDRLGPAFQAEKPPVQPKESVPRR
jgi:hypothetical protein